MMADETDDGVDESASPSFREPEGRQEFVADLTEKLSAQMDERSERSLGGFANTNESPEDAHQRIVAAVEEAAAATDETDETDDESTTAGDEASSSSTSTAGEGVDDGDGLSAPDGAPPSPEDSSAAPSPGPEVDPGPQTPQGVTLPTGWDQARIDQAASVLDWAQALPPDAIAAFDVLLSGSHILVEKSELAALEAKANGTSGTGSADSPDDSSDDFLSDLDPAAAKRIADLEARLAEVSAATSSITEREQQAEAARQAAQEADLIRTIDEVAAEFASSHNFTPAEMEDLMAEAARLSILPLHLQSNPDVAAAVSATLDQTMWAVPTFRERALAAQRTAVADEEAAQRQELVARKQRAGAVASGSGSAPRVDPTPKDHDGRQRALVDGIAAAIR